MTVSWTFRCYGAADAKDGFRTECEAQSKRVQRKFQTRLTSLAELEFSEWVKQGVLAKDLKGECAGLTEIRFEADSVQQRPLGYRAGPNEFIFLFWAQEKDDKWVPKNACKKARTRQRAVNTVGKKVRTHALWFALE